MRRELFIVSRDRPALYRYLALAFSGTSVEVVVDRRTKERRTREGGTLPTRRQSERRRRDSLDVQISLNGYAFLTIDE